ncbi:MULTISPECIES: helix-turn-helix domain-containing protein [Streptomyces]|uniref:Helix-turn-helix domain-containing protein n=1 Tax=Streptomyces ehimensis TaxID=68195 RepID=A0ABV9BPE8_9ACTN
MLGGFVPPRSNPTARQERLGIELRRMRERAGLTAREAGSLLGTGPIQISHIEAGRIGVSEERLRRMALHYRCSDVELVDALVVMAAERGRRWYDEYRGVLPQPTLDLAALEWHASGLQNVQIVHIPGLLQTEGYMRALFTYLSVDFTPDDLDAFIEFRMRRQGVLDREDPPRFTAIIHEAALRMKAGDRAVARRQLDFVLDNADRPSVSVRVIPFSAEGFAGMGFSMLYAAGPIPQLDTVQVDQVHGIAYVDAEAQLVYYRECLRIVERSALDADESRDFIRRIAREL